MKNRSPCGLFYHLSPRAHNNTNAISTLPTPRFESRVGILPQCAAAHYGKIPTQLSAVMHHARSLTLAHSPLTHAQPPTAHSPQRTPFLLLQPAAAAVLPRSKLTSAGCTCAALILRAGHQPGYPCLRGAPAGDMAHHLCVQRRRVGSGVISTPHLHPPCVSRSNWPCSKVR
jgi:hypothetical protein